MQLIKYLVLLTVTTLILQAEPAYNEQILPLSGGSAVAMDGEWAVVGDVALSDGKTKQVHAYRLNYSTMLWEKTGNVGTTNQGSEYGASVAISGERALVGNPGQAGGSGVVDLYTYNASTAVWDINVTISNPEGGKPRFGESVGISTVNGISHIVIGAPDYRITTGVVAGGTGAVYAYTWDGTALTASTTLIASTRLGHKYGASLDMKGDKLIVGAPEEVDPTTNEIVGATYSYSYNSATGWKDAPGNYENRIKGTATDGYFGTYVAISSDGNASLISVPGSNTYDSQIYNNDGTSWTQGFSPLFKGAGVDIDDEVYLMARTNTATDSLNHMDLYYFSPVLNNYTLALRLDHSTNNASLFTSVSLHKDQVLGNDVGGTQAIAYDVPCGIKPTHLIANEWAMISVPCGDGTATIDTIFGDDMTAAGAGTYCPDDDPNTVCNWVMYKDGPTYTGTSDDNVRVLETEAMKLGKGYWIIADQNVILKADGDAVTGTGITARTTVDLLAEGNTIGIPSDSIGLVWREPLAYSDPSVKKIMVGNPYPRTFKWSNVYFANSDISATTYYPIDDAQFSGIVQPNAYVYDVTQSGQPYRSVATNTPGIFGEIAPMQGFWIQLDANTTNTGFNLIALPFEK